MPLVDVWQPGVNGKQIAAAEEAIGERLPDEARLWWQWHDGVPASTVTYAREREFGPDHRFLPLEEAVARTLRMRDSPALRQPGAPHWPHAWLIWTTSTGPVVFDCGVPEGHPAPVLVADFGAYQDSVYGPVAGSLGEMVATWIRLLHARAWEWDAAHQRWLWHPTRVPETVARSRF